MWSQVWTRWKRRGYRDYRSGGTAQSKWSSVDLYNRKSINEKGTTTWYRDYPIARGQIVNIMGRCNDMANKEVIQAILLRVSRSWTKLNQFCTNNVSIVIYDENYEKQDLIFHFLLKFRLKFVCIFSKWRKILLFKFAFIENKENIVNI